MQIKPIKNSVTETYSKDIVKILESNKDGLIQKIIHEEEQREAEHKNTSPLSKKNRIFIFIGIFLLILSFGGVFLYITTSNDSTVEVAPQFTPIIFLDKTQIVEITKLPKGKILEGIWGETQNTNVKIGGVEGIYATENNKIIGFKSFMTLLKSNLPEYNPAYINENFLLGVVNDNSFKNLDLRYKVVSDSLASLESNLEEMNLARKTILLEGEPLVLNNSSFFKTGTAEFVDVDARSKAKTTISEFLDTIDFATSKVKVVGTYSVERPTKKNNAIAEARKKVGLEILNEVLTEKYTEEEIAQIVIEASAKGVSINDTYSKEEIELMTSEEVTQIIDQAQGIQYYVEAKTKGKTILTAPTEEQKKLEQEIEDVKKEIKEIEDLKKSNTNIVVNTKDPFFLIKTRSFSDVFPVFRAWEDKMFTDLHGFFGIDITPETNYLLTKDWQDGIIQNKNARILYDKDGTIVFMYVFIDENNVLITNTEKATEEIILRIASSKVRK
ncbi:MAG: hypothetical protein UU24_C0004G0007 [Candidatus Nomurabacteria bacterium GW2011_GWA2_40_9]|uniref:Uncharacterized protein n=1 Tax=Candidatus Nomurabacteria bacterium GW2011_GWA2_40_9 TaxID=1618734 RepID=A0A0G0TRR1_9BACT|nr:MAG: hypothetical protein UU24_C0004G0007 [Candidatus Nomurabacteria bacterium GW2011_GWA2_40_9]